MLSHSRGRGRRTRDDLLIAAHLESTLLREQLRLPYPERDQSDAVIGELIVNVAEPLVGIVGLSLGFIAEEHHDMTASRRESFPQPPDELLSLIGVGRFQCLARGARGQSGRISVLPAGLSVFRMGQNGMLDYVRRYEVETGREMQWWSGLVALA